MTLASGGRPDDVHVALQPAEAASELEVDEITTTQGLEALRDEWSALLDVCPEATPFQSPEWLLAWWHALGAGELHIVTLRRRGELLGLAPLFVYLEPDGTRHLTMLASGLSDYEDALLHPSIARAGAALILRHVAGIRECWDVATFQEIPASSALLDVCCPPELSIEQRPGSSCALLALPSSTEVLESALSWRFRRRLRNARNRLAREADARFVRADDETLPALLDALFRLHALRWHERGEAGVLDDPRLRRLHEEAAVAFLHSGSLRLHALLIDEQPVAVLYGFAHHDRRYMYLSGLDPRASSCSPGVLLLHHAVCSAIAEGARVFDMLRGREAYKDDWGITRQPNVALRLRDVAAGERAEH